MNSSRWLNLRRAQPRGAAPFFSLCASLAIFATLCLALAACLSAAVEAQSTPYSGTPYNVVNENSGLCVGASAQGTADGTVLEMYACANGAYSTQLSQQWIFTPASGGYDEVSDANATQEAWNVVNSGTSNGSLMQLWSYGGNSNEEFEPVSLGGGYYEFQGLGSGLCLDVPGNSTSNSVQLDIYTCNGTTAQAFKLVTPTAYGGTPTTLPGTVMAENYDTGGQGVGYSVASVNGTANGYRSDGVDLESASAPASGNDLGWAAAGQWFNYTVNVPTAGTYTVSFLVAGGSGATVPDAFHLADASGADLSGAVAVPDTGGWQTWTTVAATVTLTAGIQTLTLSEDAGGWNFDSMAFASGGGSASGAAYGGTPAPLPGTVMNENYDTGGQGVAFNVTSTNGTANGYRSDGVDLEAASSPATGNDLGWAAAEQWFNYTVNVSTAGTYTVSFLVAGGSGAAVSGAFHLSDGSGNNLSGPVGVPNTGGWQTWTTVTASVTLPAGTQTLTLNEDAGGWNIDSMGFASGSGGGGGGFANKTLVLNFLNSIAGNHTAIGVENKAGGTADSDYLASMAGNGQYPSYWGGDFGFGSAASSASRSALMQEAIQQWNNGALVALMYHACPLSWGSDETGCAWNTGTDPVDGSFGDLTPAQWVDLTTPGGTLYNVWISRLDTLAGYFQTLKDAGVAPLFRPFHEMNANWAWWQGVAGPNGSAKLYQITHDYLTYTKGLTNIIWVWNVQDFTSLSSDVNTYNPGSAYFDIASLDVYNTGYTTGNYDAMLGAANGKPIGVSECQFLPTPSLLASQPQWTYVAVWPDFLYSPNQTDNSTQVPELFNDSQVLPLSAMPGW